MHICRGQPEPITSKHSVYSIVGKIPAPWHADNGIL